MTLDITTGLAAGTVVCISVILIYLWYKKIKEKSEEIVEFRIYFKNAMNRHTIMEKHIQRMLKATLQLYWKPGINPDTKEAPQVEIQKILLFRQKSVKGGKTRGQDLGGTGMAYWWSTPGLSKEKCKQHGALTFDVILQATAWASEKTVYLWERPKTKA